MSKLELDEDLVRKLASESELLVTIEENVVKGGAGSGVSELLAANQIHTPLLQAIGLQVVLFPALLPPVVNHSSSIIAMGLRHVDTILRIDIDRHRPIDHPLRSIILSNKR